MKLTAEDGCYIGIWPECRCIRFVSVDIPAMSKDNAKDIARLIRLGYQVQHVLCSDFNAGKHGKFGCVYPNNCQNPHVRRLPK